MIIMEHAEEDTLFLRSEGKVQLLDMMVFGEIKGPAIISSKIRIASTTAIITTKVILGWATS